MYYIVVYKDKDIIEFISIIGDKKVIYFSMWYLAFVLIVDTYYMR